MSSVYNQAAYNLAAYNILDANFIAGSGAENITGSVTAAAALKTTGSEIITGNAAIAAAIKITGGEHVTGTVYTEVAVYIEPQTGGEIVTGSADIIAGLSLLGEEIISGHAAIQPGRGILPIVRARMGIYYSETHKNMEIWQLILEAKEDLITSGWPESEMISGKETEMAITAICVHCRQNIGEIDDEHASRILRGLQTKASIRKAMPQDAEALSIYGDIQPEEGILPIVRSRMGISYSDPYKNMEIWQLILEAKEDLISSGWPESEMIYSAETEMAITAICVHCLQSIGEIDDDHAFRVLRGLQTKASIRKERLQYA